MIQVNVRTQEALADFAKRAAEYFRDNPSSYTFADGDPTPGDPLAIRWNTLAVLVVKLGEEQPLCYPVWQFIKQDLPKLKGE